MSRWGSFVKRDIKLNSINTPAVFKAEFVNINSSTLQFIKECNIYNGMQFKIDSKNNMQPLIIDFIGLSRIDSQPLFSVKNYDNTNFNNYFLDNDDEVIIKNENASLLIKNPRPLIS